MKPIKPISKMNKLEERYSINLDIAKRQGIIEDWRYEAIRFKLGDGAYYKPDFLIVYKDYFEIHETKGHWRIAAKVRIKTAAMLYPWFKFKAIYYDKKKGFYSEDF